MATRLRPIGLLLILFLAFTVLAADLQSDWRWCWKCQSLFFAGNPESVCQGGGKHDGSKGGNYQIPLSSFPLAGQGDWRWCGKCQQLFFSMPGKPSACFAGGAHDPAGSGEYKLLANPATGYTTQADWNWCNKCGSLFFGKNAAQSKCPTGGAHDGSSSGGYHLIESASLPVLAQLTTENPVVVLKPSPVGAAMAYSTRWKSRVKLGHDLSAISASAFTVMARFFPIYRVPHFGAVLGVAGPNGNFAVGQWLVASENPTEAKPAFGLIVGSTQKQFPAEQLLRINQWNHLAVVFTPSEGWTAYLNGFPMGTIPDSGFRASGELSAGRIQDDKASQFYGLIDDVAVFDAALTPVQVRNYAALKSLAGSEAGLKWGWRFDADGDGMNAQSKAPVIEDNAVKVYVSPTRSPSDEHKMPAPVQALKYELPIPIDAEYYIVQGSSGNSHHWDRWAFTWDFIYAGKRSDSLSVRKANGNYQATDLLNKLEGPGQALTSIAAGTVVHANWNFVEGDGSDIPNSTIVRHAQGEYSAYYHLKQGSFPLLFPWGNPEQPFTITKSTFAAIDGGTIPTTYPEVGAWQPVGGLGGTGMKDCKDCYHLHFGVLDQPDLNSFNERITRPIHFEPFESSPDRINWTTMSGIPREGTFVRRKMIL